MTGATSALYTIRVGGHLDTHWSSSLGGLTIAHHTDGTTSLTGPLADQAQLHGVLAKLRDIAATLLALHAVEPDAQHDPSTDPAPTADQPLLTHPLRTERLILRPAAPADADATWRFRRLESVNTWLPDHPADANAHRDRFTAPHRLATTVIIELNRPSCPTVTQAAGTVIADFTLRRTGTRTHRADNGGQAELDWAVDPMHLGNGYETEAAQRLLRYCFEDLGVRRVLSSAYLDNEPSWRLMEHIGMRREAHAIRACQHRSGQWLDTVTYAVLAEEWPPR